MSKISASAVAVAIALLKVVLRCLVIAELVTDKAVTSLARVMSLVPNNSKLFVASTFKLIIIMSQSAEVLTLR